MDNTQAIHGVVLIYLLQLLLVDGYYILIIKYSLGKQWHREQWNSGSMAGIRELHWT